MQKPSDSVTKASLFFCITMLLSVILVVSLSPSFGLARNHIAPDRFLDEYQNTTLELDCPHHEIRAGSLYLTHDKARGYPNDSFSVHVRLPAACSIGSQHYRIYINVKTLNLDDADSVVLNGSRHASQRKILYGGRHQQFVHPASVAQYLTDGRAFGLEFRKAPRGFQTNRSRYEHPLTLDYSFVHDVHGIDEDCCPALEVEGYQLHNLMCWGEDRVICPSNYQDDRFDLNPAIGEYRHLCVDSDDWSPAELAVICAIAALVGIGIPVAFCMIYRRRRVNVLRYREVPSSEPLISSESSSYGTAAAAPKLLDSPPSYSDVTKVRANPASAV